MDRDHVKFVPPLPPVTPKATETRRVLIDVAAELFIERGYNAVSMQDIAERAELTKGGVYGHFRSKGQLLVEVIRWKVAEFDQSDDFADAMRSPDSAIALLLDDRGRAIRLLEVDAAAAARHDPDIAAGLSEFYRERHAAIRDSLIGVVHDPETSAWLILAVAAGIGTKDAVGIPPPAVKQFLAALRALVAHVAP